MKKIIDFMSGYAAGVVLAFFIFVAQWTARIDLGKGPHTALGDFLYLAATIIFGVAIALISLIVILVKMNNWQRAGIAACLATTSISVYFINRSAFGP